MNHKGTEDTEKTSVISVPLWFNSTAQGFEIRV